MRDEEKRCEGDQTSDWFNSARSADAAEECDSFGICEGRGGQVGRTMVRQCCGCDDVSPGKYAK